MFSFRIKCSPYRLLEQQIHSSTYWQVSSFSGPQMGRARGLRTEREIDSARIRFLQCRGSRKLYWRVLCSTKMSVCSQTSNPYCRAQNNKSLLERKDVSAAHGISVFYCTDPFQAARPQKRRLLIIPHFPHSRVIRTLQHLSAVWSTSAMTFVTWREVLQARYRTAALNFSIASTSSFRNNARHVSKCSSPSDFEQFGWRA